MKLARFAKVDWEKVENTLSFPIPHWSIDRFWTRKQARVARKDERMRKLLSI